VWNVTGFVQTEFAGDKTASLLVKATDEALAGSPSYGFDAKEFGSNAPVLRVTTQATASSVASVQFFYRFSADNVTWGGWTTTGSPDTTAPYSASFSFPNGFGHYEFYSIATDNLGGVEPTPAFAQTSVHYHSAFSLSATASTGLPVTFSTLTAGTCTVSGDVVSTIASGNCTVVANQAGVPAYWLSASATRSFTVLGVSQTIAFAPLANRTLGSGSFALSATAVPSNLPVQFSSVTLSVCTVTGNTVALLAVGTCQIAADQPGNSSYAAAPTVTRSFAITGSGSGGSGGNTVAVPVPPWALVLLAASLLGVMRRRPRKFR
jgi:hypothetical protein